MTKTVIEHVKDKEKQEWKTPAFHIIPFKNTKDGGAYSEEEDFGGTIDVTS